MDFTVSGRRRFEHFSNGHCHYYHSIGVIAGTPSARVMFNQNSNETSDKVNCVSTFQR